MLVPAPRIGQRNNRLPSAYSNLPAEPTAPINSAPHLNSAAPLLIANSSKQNKHYKNPVQNYFICALLQNMGEGEGYDGYELNNRMSW